MKDLLNWIKSEISDNLTQFKEVKVIPHIHVVPDEGGFPAVGIVDAGLTRTQLPSQQKEKLHIQIGIYNEVLRDESSIIGDAQNSGIEDYIDNIYEHFKSLVPDGYYNIEMGNESGTETLTKDNENFLVMKSIDMVFYRIKSDY